MNPALAIPEDVLADLRAIRSRLLLLVERSGSPAVAVASSVAGEGTTTTLLLLAAAIVESGREVLAIDANPDAGLTRRVGMEGLDGLGDVVAGSSVAGAVHPAELPGLSVLPWGKPGRPCPDRLDWRGLVGALRQADKVILVDLPPALSPVQVLPEALAAVDGVVLVVAAHRTRREVVLRAKAELERVGGRKLLGAVLNGRQYFIPEFLYRHA